MEHAAVTLLRMVSLATSRAECWVESDWPDLPWIFSNQHVRLTAGDGVDWQFHWWHHKALADWQPQALAQTVEWSVLAQPQDITVNQTAVALSRWAITHKQFSHSIYMHKHGTKSESCKNEHNEKEKGMRERFFYYFLGHCIVFSHRVSFMQYNRLYSPCIHFMNSQNIWSVFPRNTSCDIQDKTECMTHKIYIDHANTLFAFTLFILYCMFPSHFVEYRKPV